MVRLGKRGHQVIRMHGGFAAVPTAPSSSDGAAGSAAATTSGKNLAKVLPQVSASDFIKESAGEPSSASSGVHLFAAGCHVPSFFRYCIRLVSHNSILLLLYIYHSRYKKNAFLVLLVVVVVGDSRSLQTGCFSSFRPEFIALRQFLQHPHQAPR
jgi:hypothetical protein